MNARAFAASATALCLLSMNLLASDTSRYSGHETREIKALSEAEVAGLLTGKGMGYAKAAELNGYPGPAHVLELSEELKLSDGQKAATKALFDQMEESAQSLGAQLVAAERELDQKFRDKLVDEPTLSAIVSKIGGIESRLRELHLRAHLQQIQLLSDHQVAKYMMLRGYVRGVHETHHGHGG